MRLSVLKQMLIRFSSQQKKVRVLFFLLISVIIISYYFLILPTEFKKWLAEEGELLYLNLLERGVVYQKPEKLLLPQLIAHAGGGIAGYSYTNSLEALNESYQKGFRFFEMDFHWTKDNQLVLTHGWDLAMTEVFQQPPGQLTLKEFKKLKIAGRFTTISLADLSEWLESHPDVYLITDTIGDNLKLLTEISQKIKQLQGRIIPQIYFFREYPTARKLGFNNIIITLYKSKYNNESLLKFFKKHSVTAVTLPANRIEEELINKLKQQNIPTFVHTVNDTALADFYTKKGVSGFYTDTLNFADLKD